jgi:hypothetical protein
MRLQRPATAALAVTLLAAIVLTGCGGDDNGDPSPDVLGRQLADQYMSILVSNDRTALERFLFPTFQIQRADGTYADRQQYLDDHPQITSYTLGDEVIARREGDLLTIRWSVVLQATLDGRPVGTHEAPRLSVFTKADGRWQLVAHANFNPPPAADQ